MEKVGETKDEGIFAKLEGFKRSREEEVANQIGQIQEIQRKYFSGELSDDNSFLVQVIAHHGADVIKYPNILENFMKIAKSLKGKTGQTVVVAQRWKRSEGCTGLGGHAEDSLQRAFVMGILSSDELQFDLKSPDVIANKVFIPTKQYARISTDQHHSLNNQPQMISEPILVEGLSHNTDFNFISLGTDLGRRINISESHNRRGVFSSINMELFGPPIALEIMVGAEEISKWIDERGTEPNGHNFKYEFRTLRQMADMIGAQGVEPTTGYLRASYLGEK